MGNILIVDDEKSIRITLEEFLKQDNHNIFLAENAHSAINILEKNNIDVVVSDIILPMMNGVELLQIIKKVDPDVQVIMITGEPTLETVTKALRAGAFDYLDKPIRKESICRVVSTAMVIKTLNDDKKKLEKENKQYQMHLEKLVDERTRELKSNQDKLEMTQMLYSAVLRSTPHGLCLLNPDWTIKYANHSMNTMLCTNAESTKDLLGIAFGDLFAKYEDFRIFQQIAPPELKTKGIYLSQILLQRNNNSPFWCEVSIVQSNPIIEDSGYVATLTDITIRKDAEEKLKDSFLKLEKVAEGVINTMAKIVETRDPYTAGHQQRSAQLACAIAEQLRLDPKFIKGLHMAALIHDIGKIQVPAELLSKPGKLNHHEFNLIKIHPQAGYDILKMIEFPYPVAEIVYQHHERLNGSGYPRGLHGNQILLEAKILSVSDVVEAMTSHRPYRPSIGIKKALEEIKNNKGLLYDSSVVDTCVVLFEKNNFCFEKQIEHLY